ncbi:nucleotide-binding universal stress UspA family protein [Methanocalculus alkaliphilus]|uniref:universal stress protein n=1 Tax=Methanocalculus alkaliphilus TaxID=768730 RepID=UPI00209E4234|nr:universal stress protein [Methanocalculus alkaliphilus]MCP1715227.1 nucleotide-binding universal stress UspA family protein [Methanocalculus alkaliphilus]
MFHKLLVAIDGSEISMNVLDQAIDMARGWKAELHAVYIIETGLISSVPMDNTWEVIYSLLEQEGEKLLDTAEKKAQDAGVSLKKHLLSGHAGNEIINAAEKEGADLIIVGSRGKSQIDRLLIGSVSAHVVKYSTISTMVVRV